MTTIAILPDSLNDVDKNYRAIAGDKESVGKTAGEALDALTAQLTEDESGTLVIVQHLRPDRFFTSEQQNRLACLMSRWRSARLVNGNLPIEEQSELESLIEAELQAATQRAEAALHDVGK
jgi:hypothetical protein